jgi:hypothetical protein
LNIILNFLDCIKVDIIRTQNSLDCTWMQNRFANLIEIITTPMCALYDLNLAFCIVTKIKLYVICSAFGGGKGV